jgi:hypothetical protein
MSENKTGTQIRNKCKPKKWLVASCPILLKFPDCDPRGVDGVAGASRLGASTFLIVAQEAIQFGWRNAPEFLLEGEVDSPAIVWLGALLRRPANGVHEFSEFSRLERSLFGPVWMPAGLIVGWHSQSRSTLSSKHTTSCDKGATARRLGLFSN